MFTAVTEDRESYCIKHDYQLRSCSESQEDEVFICTVDDPEGYQETTTLTIISDGKSNVLLYWPTFAVFAL